MIERPVSAGRAARLAILLALGMLVACTEKHAAQELAQPAVARAVAVPPRCGPGLAAEDLAGNCRRKDCPTMGALEALPLDAPCPPKTRPAAGRDAPTKKSK